VDFVFQKTLSATSPAPPRTPQDGANILWMATYVYSEQQIDRMIGRTTRFRVWGCVLGALFLLAAGFLVYFHPGLFAHHAFRLHWAVAILMGFGAHLFFMSFRRRKSGSEKLRAFLKEWSLEISSAGICITYFKQRKKQLNREEILRAEETSLAKGLYLRTAKRYRYTRIHGHLDDYEAIKREIILLGIPIEKKLIFPNWEEPLFALLFFGALICAIAVPFFI